MPRELWEQQDNPAAAESEEAGRRYHEGHPVQVTVVWSSDVEQLGLHPTGRERGLCKGNRSAERHGECGPLTKPGTARRSSQGGGRRRALRAGRGQITESLEYRDGKMPHVWEGQGDPFFFNNSALRLDQLLNVRG